MSRVDQERNRARRLIADAMDRLESTKDLRHDHRAGAEGCPLCSRHISPRPRLRVVTEERAV